MQNTRLSKSVGTPVSVYHVSIWEKTFVLHNWVKHTLCGGYQSYAQFV